MTKTILSALPLLAAITLAACSGGSSEAPGGTAGPRSGDVGSSGDVGGPKPGATTSPLNGTWDMMHGATGAGTITISPTTFALDVPGIHVMADVSTAVPAVEASSTQSGRTKTGAITTIHADEALDLGQVPYALGGTWNVSGSEADRCSAEVKVGSVGIDCTNVAPPLQNTLQDYDFVEQKPLGSGRSAAQRTRKRSSIFGELGGDWTVVTPRVTCKVTFEDDRLTATCDRKRNFQEKSTGTISLTFAEGIAIGTTNAGEVSARKR